MAFNIKKTSDKKYEDIESLFRDLTRRSVPNLFSHQADILRNYQTDGLGKPNVALELPTGSGKTLVGMLIAEYRRINNGERVVFLCPTIQLVNQVVEHANKKYGIKAVGFTGSKKSYSASDKSMYRAAECIAVTTYSALFNVKPFFDDANVIILDDSHSAENYIASCWSLALNRRDHGQLYNGIINLIRPYLDHTVISRLENPSPDPVTERNLIEILPFELLDAISGELTSLLSDLNGDDSPSLYFPWLSIKNNLSACNLYFSWDSILVRPIIPPSLTNPSFTQANQRLYMSATLGSGGDLERITGVKSISRIKTPKGWDRQGLGRRYFLFPNQSFESKDRDKLIHGLLQKTNRSVVIVGNDKEAESWQDWIQSGLPEKEIFNARDIEVSKQEFIDSEDAVVVLSNRFDGIDFQNNEARLLILSQIPNHANLQERFIQSRTSAAIIFNDRNKTRLIQAIGRCTRNSNDYAAVVILGEKGLNDWFSMSEKRKLLHPELQAEINFGMDQAKQSDVVNLLENYDLFLKQSDDWAEAEKAILTDRDALTQNQISGEAQLSKSVTHEVNYLNYQWEKDYQAAFDEGVKVFEELSGGSELSGYRAFWCYLTAKAAWYEFKSSGNSIYKKKYEEYYEKVLSIVRSLNLLRATYKNSQFQLSNEEYENELSQNIETLESALESDFSITKSVKFDRKLMTIGQDLKNDDRFEQYQQAIGKIIGFDSYKSPKSGAPDPYWKSGESLVIVFEDKIKRSDDACLSLENIRQANSHEEWIKAHELSSVGNTEIYTVIVSNSTCVDEEAQIHCKNLYYWNIDDFRTFGQTSIRFLKDLKNHYVGIGDINFREKLRSDLKRYELTPDHIIKNLKPISTLFE